MRNLTYAQAVNEALKEEMRRDKNVFMIGEDIAVHGGTFGISKGLLNEFGIKRVKDTPISEAAIVGLGIGAAMNGLRPVIEIMYIDFTAVCMDQIINQAAFLRYMTGGMVTIPLVIRTQGGSGTGEAAHHSKSLEAWFVHIPGIKVVMPSTPYDAKGLFKTAIRDNNPVIFIDHKLLFNIKGPVPEHEYLIPFGEADVKCSGKDITVIATSFMVQKALKVHEVLEEEGISIEVIDPRTLNPFDRETVIKSVKKTRKLLVLQEAFRRASMGAEIIRIIVEECFDCLDCPPMLISGEDCPLPYSLPLEQAAVPQEIDIIKGIRDMVS